MAAVAEKHPRGLYVLFGTEMWERYSFYTVGAMLSLYLRDTTDGFSFSNARSASVTSTYNMFIYFTPLLGGLIADRLTGFRKAIIIGGVSFMIGHALLAVPDNLFICYLALTFLVIGNGFFKPNVSSMVGNLYQEGSHLKDKAYLIFYMGINIGALMAPLVANFIQPRWGFHPAFFMGAIGMILSLIVFGLNQKYVRHADYKSQQKRGGDFTRADGSRAYQAAVAVTEDLPPVTPEAAAMAAVPEWKRIMALIVIFLIVIVFWMVFHQNSISLTWWAEDHSRRLPGILSFAINPLFIIILSVPLAAFWSWLDTRNLEPSTPMKMMIGMILTGLSFVILYFAANSGGFTKPVFPVVQSVDGQTFVHIAKEAREHLKITAPPSQIEVTREGKTGAQEAWPVVVAGNASVKDADFVRLESHTPAQVTVAPTARVSALWLVVAYFVLSLGELMLSPMGLSLVSKVAPIRMRGLMMGGWFAATAIGNKLTGVAGYWDLWSHANFFILLAGMALAMAVVLILLMRPLKKAMPGV
jgi:POT family proton-dependent oligopeptide transporter